MDRSTFKNALKRIDKDLDLRFGKNPFLKRGAACETIWQRTHTSPERWAPIRCLLDERMQPRPPVEADIHAILKGSLARWYKGRQALDDHADERWNKEVGGDVNQNELDMQTAEMIQDWGEQEWFPFFRHEWRRQKGVMKMDV